MIPEDVFVIQIKIIVADFLTCHTAFSKTVVERDIQMVINSINSDNIPGMPVFDAFFRVIAADGDHAPKSKCVTENLHRLGNALADAHALSQRTYDLVRIGFF